jgi:hypothetical protein
VTLPGASRPTWFIITLRDDVGGLPAEPHVHAGYGAYVQPDECSVAGSGAGGAGAAPFTPRAVTTETAHFEARVWTRRSGRVVLVLSPRTPGTGGPVGRVGGLPPRLPCGATGDCVAIESEFRTVLGSAFSGLHGDAAVLPAARGVALPTGVKDTTPVVPVPLDADCAPCRLDVWQVASPGFHRHWLVDLHQVCVAGLAWAGLGAGVGVGMGMGVGVGVGGGGCPRLCVGC